jgi:hypothetical protein
MKKLFLFLMLALFAATLSACSAERFSRNVYEGVRLHNESLKWTPLDQAKGEPLSYDRYEQERQGGLAGRRR